MQMVIGAAIFAAGCLFGAWLILTGQQSQKNRMGKSVDERRIN